ncbi:DUF305 domain-containing protein [Gemmatimonas sp.]|nr:DUF305 domain-containing protein [Gemmatimonas sp.]MCA2984650.1 DUF305 domain-containing protein [Gemmatimonas sp.]MCA2991335.1 DUF305 domain-containing protein [Gemmatimonas sp.]MCA2995705.1 DUF305 domain-containing protein [Gemmatimonas sp.]MCE2953756.1 DUF305 domain-containing protein [Gemmatimonas sp.]MCZ8013634.1 DUF305 domain-containing protein [Gemmatimonas sp.]
MLRLVCPLLLMMATLPAPLVAQQGVPAAQPPVRYTPSDVTFMQGMIGHHAQALVMCALVAERSSHPQLALLAERLSVSQQDEIAIMRQWLEARGLPVPALAPVVRDARDTTGHAPAPGHAEHTHAAHTMPGMLSPAQMDTLARARGASFDRLFLEYMIQHHEGALVMVAQLLATADAARDPMIFQFASDVDTDQRAEIRRMRALLATR